MNMFGKVFFVLGVVGLVVLMGIWIGSDYKFSKGCKNYLKLSADAVTIERADMFLDKALGYIEEHKLTSGNSAIFFKTPDCDMGIWYEQLKSASKVLKDTIKNKNASELEKSNTLMKLRECLLDSGENGVYVTRPEWISLVPNQAFLALWGWIIGLTFIITGIVFIVVFC